MIWLKYIVPVSTLIVLIITYTQRKSNILWVYLLLSLITDIISIITRWYVKQIDYNIFISIFIVIEFIAFVYYYYQSRVLHKIATISLIAVSCIFFTVSFAKKMDIIIIHALSLIPILCLSLFTYFKILNQPITKTLNHNSLFWGNTAIFIYASAAFLLRLGYPYLKNYTPQIQQYIFLLFLLFVVAKNILIGVSLRKKT